MFRLDVKINKKFKPGMNEYSTMEQALARKVELIKLSKLARRKQPTIKIVTI